MVERVVYGGPVKNNVISDKNDYFNFKQKGIQSKSNFGIVLHVSSVPADTIHLCKAIFAINLKAR